MARNSTTSNNAPKSNLPALAFFPDPRDPHAFPKIADGESALVPQCLPSIQSQAHTQASMSMLVLCNAKAWRGFAPKAEEQQGVMSPSQGMVPSHIPSAVGVPHLGQACSLFWMPFSQFVFPFPFVFFLFSFRWCHGAREMRSLEGPSWFFFMRFDTVHCRFVELLSSAGGETSRWVRKRARRLPSSHSLDLSSCIVILLVERGDASCA